MSKAGETEAKHEDIYYVVYRYTTNQIDFTLFAVSQLSSGPESFFFLRNVIVMSAIYAISGCFFRFALFSAMRAVSVLDTFC